MVNEGVGIVTSATIQPAKWKWMGGETAVLVLAAFLRFYRIDASSLWSDEGNTWAMIQRSIGEIALHAAADIHPPGYYWLLKGWSLILGTDAAAMRAFSAVCGVLLVWAVARIAGEVVADRPDKRWLVLLAAFVAAVNPFQIYYSQEARMYMLLALEAALLMWGLLWLLRAESRGSASGGVSWRSPAPSLALYGVAAIAGLWTHYSFPIVLLAAGIAWLVWWLRSGHTAAPLLRFAVVNLVALGIFVPWLSTAIHQLTTWPAGGASLPLLAGLELMLRTLLLGLMHTMPSPAWLWAALAAFLPIVGIFTLRRSRALPTLLLWLLLPIGMMAAFGLFTDAFLKFLLVASAPWCILVAASAESSQRWVAPWLRIAVAVGAAVFALLALPPYWQDANARDNYAGVARYIAATADPATDMVLLNGPGQADVWRYYDTTFPVLPIPDSRPADPARVESQLSDWTAGRRAVHALLWATEQSDPGSIVTGWLDNNLFKGQESWQNNVRYARYFVDDAHACTSLGLQATAREGAHVLVLESVCLTSDDMAQVAAGDPYMVQFVWMTERPLDRRYKVSVQIVQGGETVIAQHDGEPAGGSLPTIDWQPGESVQDRHAVLIPIGSIPGDKSVRVVVYDADSGAPLRFGSEDHVDLAMRVTLPAANPPIEMLPMDAIVDQRVEGVTLLGYSQYKKDFGHAPETPLQPDDTVRLSLFWQAPNPLPEGWLPNQQVTLTLGNVTITSPLAGVEYPTEMWQPGQIVRGDFDLPYDGSSTQIRVTVGKNVVRLAPLPR